MTVTSKFGIGWLVTLKPGRALEIRNRGLYEIQDISISIGPSKTHINYGIRTHKGEFLFTTVDEDDIELAKLKSYDFDSGTALYNPEE